MNLDDLAIKTIMCGRCEARPGYPCVTITGRQSTSTHAARSKLLYDAWRDGYREGLTEARDAAQRLATSNVLASANAVVTMLERRALAR